MFFLKQTFIAIDQLINAILGGWADETLSSRAWRCGWIKTQITIDTILFFDKNHCYMSYVSEKKRLQTPPELRD